MIVKPALSDEILMSVDKPARYIGNEINCVIKDKDKIDIRFAMCFPVKSPQDTLAASLI